MAYCVCPHPWCLFVWLYSSYLSLLFSRLIRLHIDLPLCLVIEYSVQSQGGSSDQLRLPLALNLFLLTYYFFGGTLVVVVTFCSFFLPACTRWSPERCPITSETLWEWDGEKDRVNRATMNWIAVWGAPTCEIIVQVRPHTASFLPQKHTFANWLLSLPFPFPSSPSPSSSPVCSEATKMSSLRLSCKRITMTLVTASLFSKERVRDFRLWLVNQRTTFCVCYNCWCPSRYVSIAFIFIITTIIIFYVHSLLWPLFGLLAAVSFFIHIINRDRSFSLCAHIWNCESVSVPRSCHGQVSYFFPRLALGGLFWLLMHTDWFLLELIRKLNCLCCVLL